MVGKVKTASEIEEAIAYRTAGWSISAISERTGISHSTLDRHFKTHGVAKGSVSTEAVDKAAAELQTIMSDTLRREIAAAIIDDVSTFKAIRGALMINLEQLMADHTLPSHYRARGLAAIATSLKLTSDTISKTLQIHNQEIEQSELPELVVRELTAEEVEEIRRAQLSDPLGFLPANVDEVDTAGNEIVEEF